jgi:SAM-dependent methyltransferase
MPIPAEAVRYAYRMFLGRDPENEDVVRLMTQHTSLDDLGREFALSAEFKQRSMVRTTSTFSGREPAQRIDWEVSADRREALWSHTERTWTKMGVEEPYWSVLSVERFKGQRDPGFSGEGEFLASGGQQLALAEAALRRAGVDPAKVKTCVEYGCGVGRVTAHLARRFSHVHAFDISASHLARADVLLKAGKLTNVTLHHVRRPADVLAMPEVDLILSIIVLQHNPPPLIGFLVDTFLSRLSSGGTAVFQVPTYIAGYSFDIDAYLKSLAAPTPPSHIEMHALPQLAVFRIAARHGCDICEVFEDAHTGYRVGERSNTFVVRRPAAAPRAS